MNTNDQTKNQEVDILESQGFKICEHCGTKFYRLDYTNYQYRLNFNGRTHFYCRYNCWRAVQRELEERAMTLKRTKR